MTRPWLRLSLVERAAEDHRALRRARTAVTVAFAAHAILSGLVGPWIPRLQARAGIDPAGLGVALTCFAIGLLLGTRLAGPAIRRARGRGVVRGGLPLLGAGFALLPSANSLTSLAAVFLGIGVFAGLVDVAMNIEAVAVESRFGRRVMTAIHGTWSVSMFVGAALASLGIAARIPIDLHLPISAAFIVAASSMFLRWLPVDERIVATSPPGDAPPHPGGSRLIVLLCLIAGAAFLIEGVAIEWSAVYLGEAVGAGPGAAGLGLVAFSAGMAASRFVGDRLVGRFGQPPVVRTGASCALVAIGALLMVQTLVPSILAFGIMGAGLGPVVPLTFRSAGSLDRPGGKSALPVVVTAGYVGSIVGPLLVGFVADEVNLRTAFLVPLVAGASAAIAAAATRDL
jgi:predicted MFS family arabinose efflux permease